LFLSTIIKLITGEVKPPEGEVRTNPRLRIGVYNQHFVDRLPMEEDPVTYLRRLYSEETYQSVRNKLGKYGLEGHAHTIPIRDLSGGQKARVVFVELSLMQPHLLFLDEPTNNLGTLQSFSRFFSLSLTTFSFLDIESIDALCIALKEYNGGVVLVSHDARLIESVECQLWVVEDHNVTPWQTGFDGYRSYLLKKLEEQLAAIMPGSGERPDEKVQTTSKQQQHSAHVSGKAIRCTKCDYNGKYKDHHDKVTICKGEINEIGQGNKPFQCSNLDCHLIYTNKEAERTKFVCANHLVLSGIRCDGILQ
jgi:ABC-type multidrug transport system ATPase subunit